MLGHYAPQDRSDSDIDGGEHLVSRESQDIRANPVEPFLGVLRRTAHVDIPIGRKDTERKVLFGSRSRMMARSLVGSGFRRW